MRVTKWTFGKVYIVHCTGVYVKCSLQQHKKKQIIRQNMNCFDFFWKKKKKINKIQCAIRDLCKLFNEMIWMQLFCSFCTNAAHSSLHTSHLQLYCKSHYYICSINRMRFTLSCSNFCWHTHTHNAHKEILVNNLQYYWACVLLNGFFFFFFQFFFLRKRCFYSIFDGHNHALIDLWNYYFTSFKVDVIIRNVGYMSICNVIVWMMIDW